MPSKDATLSNDFFSKKKNSKKKKQTDSAKATAIDEDEENAQEVAEEEVQEDGRATVTDAADADDGTAEVAEPAASAEEATPLEEEEEGAADAEGAAAPPEDEPPDADVAYRDGEAQQVEEAEVEGEVEEEEEEEGEVKEYPSPSRTERRIDPEDGEAYKFDEFVRQNCETFTLEEIVAYWFDEMYVEEDGDRVPEDEEEKVHEAVGPPATGAVGSDSMVIDTDCVQGEGWGQDFVANHREAIEIYTWAPGSSQPQKMRSLPPVQSADALMWSVDGRFLGMLVQNSLQVLEVARDYQLLCELLPQGGERSQGIKAFHFSSAAGYVVVYEPCERGDNNAESEVNLRVWQLASEPTPVCAFYLDRRTEAAWPALKWTQDEQWCCRLVKDGIQVFDSDAFSSATPSGTITCEGVTAFEVSGESGSNAVHVALFVPDRKGSPARCLVYCLDNLSEPTAIQEVAQAHNVSIHWNHTATAVLFWTSTDVDDTGASYYGNTMLSFICADGSHAAEVVTSDVQDVAWSPVADEFLLISGKTPSEMTLHGGRKAEQQMTFGKDYRNKIQWGPFGRFFTLGGFKTLKGDIDFWDRSSGYLLGKTLHECCVDCQWSPDGRFLLGSTSFPRMKVENRIELFDYVGNRLSKIQFKELYSASWRPMPGSFEDRPETPGRSSLRDRVEETSHTLNTDSGSFADRLRAAKKGGARTKAMTTAEQEAELAAERKERLEREEREKLAEQRARRTAEVAKQPTPQEFREVLIPEELVGGVIGAKGSTIKELKKETNFNLDLSKDATTGEHRLVIGPAHPWDDLDKAVAIVNNHLDELRAQKQDKGGKGSRKGKGSGKDSIREVSIPADLVGGVIGAKGATIEDIRWKAGGPNGVKLWVLPPKEGESERKIQIGPGDPEILDRAEELIQAKLEELRNMVVEPKGGKDSGKHGKGGKTGGKEGKDGKGGDRGENGWSEKGRSSGKEPGGRKGGWEKGSDGWKGGKRDAYDEDPRSHGKSQGFQLDEASFGPSLADAMGRKGSKDNMVPEAARRPDSRVEGPWVEEKSKGRVESAWAEDKSNSKNDGGWAEAQATKTSWADESCKEGKWAEWSEDVGEWEEENKGRHDGSWQEEKSRVRSEGKWSEDKGRGRDSRWSDDKGRGRTDGTWADEKPRGKRDGQWAEDKSKSRADGTWSEDRNKGRDDGKWSDDKSKTRADGTWADDRKKGRNDGKWTEEKSRSKAEGAWPEEKSKGRNDTWTEDKGRHRGDGSWTEDKGRGRGEASWKESKGKGRGDNSWPDDRGKGRGDSGWSEDRGKGRAEASWADDKSRSRGDASWTEEKAKGRGQTDRDRGKSKGENGNGWSSKWGSGDRHDWSQEQESAGQSKRGGSNRSEGADHRAASAQESHSSAGGGGGRSPGGSGTSAASAAPDNFSRDSAFAALRDGDLQRAKQLFDKVLRLNSRDEHALVGRSEVCLLLGDANKSLHDALLAKRVNPEFHTAWLRRAKAEEQLGRKEDADKSYREARRLEAASSSKAVAAAADEGEKLYVCGDCGQSPDLGAVDPEDGIWYCKACWEAMYTAEQEEETEEVAKAQEPPPEAAPTRGSGGAGQPSSRQAPGRQRPHERQQTSQKAQAPEKVQALERQQAASERPQAADARTSFMPKNPFGAARPTQT